MVSAHPRREAIVLHASVTVAIVVSGLMSVTYSFAQTTTDHQRIAQELSSLTKSMGGSAQPFVLMEKQEIVQELPNGAIAESDFNQYRKQYRALWGRKVVIDHEHFSSAPANRPLLFSPQPDLTFRLRYRWHKDYGGNHTAWNGDLLDGGGDTVGQFSAVRSAEGYLRIHASTGERTFNVVPLPDQPGQMLMYETDPSIEPERKIGHATMQNRQYEPLTEEKVQAVLHYLSNHDKHYQETLEKYGAYIESLREQSPGRRLERAKAEAEEGLDPEAGDKQ